LKVSAPLVPETFGAALLSTKPRLSLTVLRSRSATAALSDGSPPETTLQQRYQCALRFGIPLTGALRHGEAGVPRQLLHVAQAAPDLRHAAGGARNKGAATRMGRAPVCTCSHVTLLGNPS